MIQTGQTPAEAFARDGFYIAPSLFSATETRVLKAEIARILEEVRRESEARGEGDRLLASGGVYVGLSARSEKMRQLHRDPRLLDILEAVYAPNIEFLSDKVVYKSEGMDYASPWHQDWPYWHGAHKISVWLALDDATVANGCMKLLPGSHHAPIVHDGAQEGEHVFGQRLRQGAVDESKAVTAELAAGGAVFFLDLTLHASHPNTAKQDRWAWIGTYRDAQAEDLNYAWAVARAVVRGTGRH